MNFRVFAENLPENVCAEAVPHKVRPLQPQMVQQALYIKRQMFKFKIESAIYSGAVSTRFNWATCIKSGFLAFRVAYDYPSLKRG